MCYSNQPQPPNTEEIDVDFDAEHESYLKFLESWKNDRVEETEDLDEIEDEIEERKGIDLNSSWMSAHDAEDFMQKYAARAGFVIRISGRKDKSTGKKIQLTCLCNHKDELSPRFKPGTKFIHFYISIFTCIFI